MSAPAIEVGTKLPELKFYGDPTFIVSTAIAPATIRMSTTTGTRLRPRVPRTSSSTSSPTPVWCSGSSPTGPARPPSSSRSACAGCAWYAYDTVTFTGEVTAVEDGLITLKIVGSNSLGDHVIANATLTIGAA